jgi:nucleotide-binding universal stress UspA family protein
MPDQPAAAADVVSSGRRVVVGVDGSSGSQAALRWAVVEAGMRTATLHAVMCWPTDSGRRVTRIGNSPSDDGLAMLNRFIAEATAASGGPAVTVMVSVRPGNPTEMLIEAAEHADLLVVGSRGHGSVVGALIGSVSHDLVTHAPCIVVVVPDADQLQRRDAAASSRRAGGHDALAQSSQAEDWTAMRSQT